jgi:cobalt-zinc-cadmium efflux system outer membrane protein
MPAFRRFVAFALLFSATALAEPALVISITSVADRVRAQNPDLAAARLQIQEALGRMNQAGRLPNPSLETAFENNTNFREGRLEIGIAQKFPVTNRLAVERSISISELKAAEAEVLEVERNLIAQARLAVIQGIAHREKQALVRRQATLAESLAERLSTAAATGEASSLDAGLARLEAASLTVEIRQLDAAITAAEGTLKPLLGIAPGTPIHLDGTLPAPTIPPSTPTTPRPDLQAAFLRADAAGHGVALEQARSKDDIEAAVFAAAERSEDAPDGLANEAIIGFRLSIPLPLRTRNEGNIQAAQATHQRRQLEAAALGQSIRLETETTRREMQDWANLVDQLSTDLIPLANQQTSAAETALTKGEGDVQQVFRARAKHLELTLARLDALREFHLARVRHESATFPTP